MAKKSKSNPSSKDVIVKDGTVVEALKNTSFRVKLDEQTAEGEHPIVFARLAGKLRRYYIRVFAGDKVKMEFSPHDLTQGRITRRY